MTDPDIKEAIRLRDTDPDAYDRLSPSTHMSVGYYEAAKAAAGQEQ
ncbi:hypothetical protein [Nocardioides xinjiangensis]|nr:hypothetical protein [Nocardioides sp. SYSU D00514]